MDAVHIKTSGFQCGACPHVIERAVSGLTGVCDVVSVRSLGLTSVLFDESLVTRESLCERIRRVGFEAEIYCPHRVEDCPEVTDCDTEAGSSPSGRR